MKIFDFYRSILKLGLMDTDDNGHVVVKTSDGLKPVEIDGKPLVLPTDANIKEGTVRDGTGRTTFKYEFFHPLKEDVIRPENKSLAKLRIAVTNAFNAKAYYIFMALLDVVNKDVKGKVFANKAAMIADFNISATNYKELVDDKTVKLFDELFTKAVLDENTAEIVHLYLKRGGKGPDGKKYNRMAVVSFPLYEVITTATNREIYGTRLRNKDYQLLKGLYGYLYPDIDSPDSYKFTSDDGVSPGLIALLTAVYSLASRYNEIIEGFKLEGEDEYASLIDLDWVDYISDQENYKKDMLLIPLDSSVTNTQEPPPAINQSSGPQAQPVQVMSNTPVPTTVNKPTAVETERGLDPRSILGSASQPTMFQQPMVQPTTYPQQQPQVPVQQRPLWPPQQQPAYPPQAPTYPQPVPYPPAPQPYGQPAVYPQTPACPTAPVPNAPVTIPGTWQ